MAESKKSRATRASILDAAAEVLGKHPRASTADIASAAGIGRATLHRYYASRAALIQALAHESIAAIDEACAAIDYMGQSPTLSLRQTLEAIAPLGSRYAFLAYQGEAFEDPELVDALARQVSEMRELVEAVKAEGGFGPDVPTAWIVAAMDALIYAAWLEVRAGSLAPRDVAELVFRTLTSGLGPSA